MRRLLIIGLGCLIGACGGNSTSPNSPAGAPSDARFQLMDPAAVGMSFINEVKNDRDFNIFSYRNFYNGGGVAMGDLNNDGLTDVYLTANQGSNKLYLNKGNWQFEDITEKAGVGEAEKWSTGVVMVDLNADGLLDIYVCNAGYRKGIGQENALFINQGDLTFKEAAAEYGLADNSYTTHAGFFDYDLDGDLDVYMLNNSFLPVNTLNYSNKRDLRAEDWEVRDFLKGGGDKFLRNDGGKFVDISERAGVYGSLIGFGLGVTIGDVNGDHYPDIYVSNDFFERDYLYVNQQDGTFSEELQDWMQHISHSSMGADMADINNDGYPEIFVTDMLPDDEFRLKTTSDFDNINLYRLKQSRGFYHQYMHNTLQLNDQNERFMEIAHFSGVAASDWSWGALIFDADNDGWSDIYVCNGIYHDVIDQDFIDFFANEAYQKMALTGKKEEMDSIINKMPSNPIANKAFRNTGRLKFEDVTESWGMDKASFSNGAAYGDLDNDGDLDLIINNVNQELFVYQNHTDSKDGHHFVGVSLKGSEQNTFGIGAKVELYLDDQLISRQAIPSRGFQSSIDYKLPIGIGEAEQIDSLRVIWPDRTVSRIINPPVDSFLLVTYQADGEMILPETADPSQYLMAEVPNVFESHVENEHYDFYVERNIPVMNSQEGPRTDQADVNGDGLIDLYVGGAAGQAGQLYLQTPTGYRKKRVAGFEEFKLFEDTAVRFFDADGDGDVDLYVGSGGNDKPFNNPLMKDRLYLNDGSGDFTADPYALPNNGMNTSVIAPYDYDSDGDLDLFVGAKGVPGNYGMNPPSYLYENAGPARFRDVAGPKKMPIAQIGNITDAIWLDVKGGTHKELILVGEWMAPKIFSYNGTTLKEVESNLDAFSGWWYTVESADVDKDGDQDLLLGNLGENFYLKADSTAPLKIWISDFDQNQSIEKIITRSIDGRDMPVPLKRDITDQLASLKRQNLQHKDYATKAIQDLFPAQLLDPALKKQATYLKSCVAINLGNGQFEIRELAPEVQLSCINDAEWIDLNQDGFEDLVLGGNNYDFLPQFSRLDASYGHVLINDQKGNFSYLPNRLSGFYVEGEIKDFEVLTRGDQRFLLALVNNQKPVMFKLK
ncbi:MAG: VCBS repeat-containing protein [Bacteroidota bacterium]